MKFLVQCGDHREEFVIPEGSTVIGSRPGCRLQLDFPGVLPRHAQCYSDGLKHVTIKTLSDKHPLSINGREVDRADLHPYDEIRLGEVTLTFVTEPRKEEPAADKKAPAGEQAAHGIAFDEAPDDSRVEQRPASMSLAPVGKPQQALSQAREGRPTELIHREGKWILRDLVSGREVEITPREAEEIEAGRTEPVTDEVDAHPLPPQQETATRASKPLPGRALALGGLLVVAVVALLLLVRQERKPPEKKLMEYERTLRMGFAFLANDDLEQAIGHLRKGTRLLPESKIAQILLDIAQLESEKGENHVSYRWDSAESLYQELERFPDATAQMREFAHQRIVFITSFRVHQTALKEAEDLMALGRSVEAFDKARQIPPDSVLVKQDPARFAKIRQEAVADLLNKARVAQQEGNWDRALKYAKDAADADPGSAQAEKALSLARRAKTAATRLEAAQELFDASKKLEESPAEALQLLRKALAELQEEGARPVFEGTPLESRGQGLLKDIEGRMAAVQGAKVTSSVSQLFAQGNGKAALELLEKEKDSLPASTLVLKPKILEAVRLLDAATQMDENKQFETAREAWQRLVETVADDPNEYRRRALARLQWYKENANLVAEEYRKLALAMVEDNPPAARKALNSAKGWSPENPEVLKALAELDKKAELYFRLGYALRNRAEDKEKAREHFLNVLRYAEENSDRAIQARLEMKKLED